MRFRDSTNYSLEFINKWVCAFDLILFIMLTLVLCKTLLSSFYPYWDSLAYHLPFAARIAGIYSRYEFEFMPHLETFFTSFPLLPFFLEGTFWKLTGSISAAALINLIAFVFFGLYLRFRYRIHLTVTSIFFFSVPLIFLNFFSYYYDNFVGVFVALSFLSLYSFIKKSNWLDVVICVSSIFVVSSSKYTGLLFVVITYVVLFTTLLKRRDYKKLILICILYPFVFFYPLRNLILYKDPIYPVATGLVQTSRENNEDLINRVLNKIADSGKFYRSIFEIEAYDDRRPSLWVIDQGSVPSDSKGFRMGGFYWVNIVFWGILMCFIFLKNKYEKRENLILIGCAFGLAILISFMPSSYELRYYNFYPMLLFSIVLIKLRSMPKGVVWTTVIIQLLVCSNVYRHLYHFSSLPVINFNTYQLVSNSSQVCVVSNDSRKYFLTRLGTSDKTSIKSSSSINGCGVEREIIYEQN